MSKTTTKQFDDFIKQTTELNTEYSEACAKSGSIFMKGVEDMMGAVMSLAQESSEKQSKFFKTIMDVKNVNDFADVQAKIAQENFDDFMAGATKISEISTRVLTESTEPVSAQVTKAVQNATKAMAA